MPAEKVERERQRRARYRRGESHIDGRPCVDDGTGGDHDPLLEILKTGAR